MEHHVDKEYDLVVCGGGAAGFCAAVQGARVGLKTALVERYGIPGGIMTVMGNVCIFQFVAHQMQIIRGIGWEFILRLHNMGYAGLPNPSVSGPNYAYGVGANVPAAAHMMDIMMLEAGVDLYYGQPVVDVETVSTGNGNTKLNAVRIASKEGIRRLSGRIFIDCTGDGDLSVYAGAAWECGDTNNKDCYLQPGTLRFYTNRVSMSEDEIQRLDAVFEKRIQEGTLLEADLCGKRTAAILGGDGDNVGHISGFNGAFSDSKTASEVEGRRSIFRIQQAIKEAHVPLEITNIAPEVAVRESRRIVCDGYISVDEYIRGYEYPDAVCTSLYCIDLHRDSDKGIYQIALTDGQVPTIPLSAMQVKGVDNLLTAGRCVSGDRLANSAFRVKASCMAMGQAAAACASVALQENVSIRKADISKIRALLRKHDAIVTHADVLHFSNNLV
jgi:hypothetical protein